MTNGATGTENPTNQEPRSTQRFESFGALLRFYRETYGERMQRRDPTMPRVKLTALALIECLRKRGYSITSGTLSEIEAGSNIPRDPKAFIDAVSLCLGLEIEGEDWRALVQFLAYDIVRARVGPEVAELTVKRALPRWLR